MGTFLIVAVLVGVICWAWAREPGDLKRNVRVAILLAVGLPLAGGALFLGLLAMEDRRTAKRGLAAQPVTVRDTALASEFEIECVTDWSGCWSAASAACGGFNRYAVAVRSSDTEPVRRVRVRCTR
jgi:hypothetical protein